MSLRIKIPVLLIILACLSVAAFFAGKLGQKYINPKDTDINAYAEGSTKDWNEFTGRVAGDEYFYFPYSFKYPPEWGEPEGSGYRSGVDLVFTEEGSFLFELGIHPDPNEEGTVADRTYLSYEEELNQFKSSYGSRGASISPVMIDGSEGYIAQYEEGEENYLAVIFTLHEQREDEGEIIGSGKIYFYYIGATNPKIEQQFKAFLASINYIPYQPEPMVEKSNPVETPIQDQEEGSVALEAGEY